MSAAPELYAQMERAADLLERVGLQEFRNVARTTRELLAKARGGK